LTDSELFPDGLRRPTSLFIAGTNRSLLKWVALAVFAPYSSRVYWTDVRLQGEVLDPLDPISLKKIPADRVQVVHPRELRTDEQEARLVEAAAATMFRSDEPPESLRRITDFLRLPPHTQERISRTTSVDEPTILVASNAHRLAGLYPPENTEPMIRAILDSGTCIVLLWADAVASLRSSFDIVLNVDGSGPSEWREATLTCEKGISSGPRGAGTPCRLSDLGSVARILEKSVPNVPAR
jgi:hypothetical protein